MYLIAEPIQNCRDLCPLGVTLRLQLVIAHAVDQLSADCPGHSVLSPVGDAFRIGKGQGRVALQTVENCHQNSATGGRQNFRMAAEMYLMIGYSSFSILSCA